MPLTVRELVRSIEGVVRLARFDPAGMACFDRTPDGALRSFWVAALLLPPYILLVAVRDGAELSEVPLALVLLVQGIAYVVGWTAFPAAMHLIARLIGRAGEYPGMVAAYNWSAILQIALQLPLLVLMMAGVIDGDGVMGYAFAVLAVIVVYLWFVLKTALNVSGVAAAGLVVLELVITALVSDYTNHILGLAMGGE
jgi:hypothetical protein